MIHQVVPVDTIVQRFEIALQVFLEQDVYLLTADVNERTITHKLAEYLQALFPKWNVDCEYNRDGKQAKTLLMPDGPEVIVYPDIIVHQRGNNDHNLLVVEAKKSSDQRSNGADYDRKKLEAFSNNPRFRYTVGAFVVFNTEDCASVPPVECIEYYYERAWHPGQQISYWGLL